MSNIIHIKQGDAAMLFNNGVRLVAQTPRDGVYPIVDVTQQIHAQAEEALKGAYGDVFTSEEIAYWSEIVTRITLLGFILPTVASFTSGMGEVKNTLLDAIAAKFGDTVSNEAVEVAQ
jgi:hypothetical protein